MKYNLKIRNDKNTFEEYANIKGTDCREKVSKLMKEYHDINYKMTSHNFFNILNSDKRPINPFIKHFLTISYC